jgi:hypothetical protein
MSGVRRAIGLRPILSPDARYGPVLKVFGCSIIEIKTHVRRLGLYWRNQRIRILNFCEEIL